jgi:hypothetical protein
MSHLLYRRNLKNGDKNERFYCSHMKSKCHSGNESNRNKSNPNPRSTYLDSANGIRVMSSNRAMMSQYN